MIVILSSGREGLNAIEQASVQLSTALETCGYETRLVTWERGRLATVRRLADVLIVPYNPFMWGRRGFAPALVRDLTMLRLFRPRPKVVLVVHEPYIPIRDLKSAAMGVWQRAQLGLLLLLADRRFASIELWATKFSRIRATAHLPSGSTLPDGRRERESARRALDLEGSFVVATLSTGHPSHLTTYVEAVLLRLEQDCPSTVFLQLGAGAAGVSIPGRIRCERFGFLPAERLASLVAATDLLLTPFVDGVSTRRTSFLAGLCQEVAVLGTRGPLTDPMLMGRGLELVDVGRSDVFADRAVELALDTGRRLRAARAGRILFEAEFSWEAIANRVVNAIGSA